MQLWLPHTPFSLPLPLPSALPSTSTTPAPLNIPSVSLPTQPLSLPTSTTQIEALDQWGYTDYLSFSATDYYSISSLTVKYVGDSQPTKISPNSWDNAYWVDLNADMEIDITTTPPDLSQYYTGTVTVDNVSKVAFTLCYDAINLHDGSNTIMWPKSLSKPSLQISSALPNHELYQVAINDTVLSSDLYGSSLTLDLSNGDSIDVKANWPDKLCAINIAAADPSVNILDVISAIEIEDDSLDLATLSLPLSYPMGTYYRISFDTHHFAIGSTYTLNGVHKYCYGTAWGVLKDDSQFVIDATPLTQLSATLTVHNPDLVSLKPITQTNGTPTIAWTDSITAAISWPSNIMGQLKVAPIGHTEITVLKAADVFPPVAALTGDYYELANGDSISINASPLSPQGKILVKTYLGNTSLKKLYFCENGSYDKEIDLDTADNASSFLDIYADINYFEANISTKKYSDSTELWVNTSKATSDWGSSFSLNLPPNVAKGFSSNPLLPGDVVRVYAGCSDIALCSMSLSMPPALASIGFSAKEEGFRPLPLSNLSVSSSNPDLLATSFSLPTRGILNIYLPDMAQPSDFAVSINGSPVPFDEASQSYPIPATPDAHIIISTDPAGIISVDTDLTSPGSSATLFDLQGRPLDVNPATNPTHAPGLYILRSLSGARKIVL